jgi:hypothetical protein
VEIPALTLILPIFLQVSQEKNATKHKISQYEVYNEENLKRGKNCRHKKRQV